MDKMKTASRNKQFSGIARRRIYVSDIDGEPVNIPQTPRCSKLSDIYSDESKYQTKNDDVIDEYEGESQRKVMSIIQPKQKKFFSKKFSEYNQIEKELPQQGLLLDTDLDFQ